LSRKKVRREARTLKDVKVIGIELVRDNSDDSAARTEEARNLIAQMIEMSHQRGRPRKEEKEVPNAA
jgi:hypothetical protein